MSESKLELVDNAAFLSPDDFLAAIIPQRKFFEFKGNKVAIRGANAFDLFRLVKRFPKARAMVHNLADFMFGSDRDPDELLARFNTRSVVDVLIDIGDDAAAAFVSICLDKAGDEAYEAALRQIGNEALIGLLNAALTETFGGKSPQDFFTGLLIDFEKMGIRREPKKKPATKPTRQPSKTSIKAA